MPSTQPNDPVLHCTVKDFLLVRKLAQRIILKGIYFNTSVFSSPPITFAVFHDAVDKLYKLILSSKGNTSNKKLRKVQCKLVFGYLKQLLLYTKLIANNDLNIIILSGFDANSQPDIIDIPDAPVIIKVCEGKAPGTYKVYLTRKNNKLNVTKDPTTHSPNLRYCIEITTTLDDDSSWVNVLECKPKTKLVFKGLISGCKYYVRVYGVSSLGRGISSQPYPFIPQ